MKLTGKEIEQEWTDELSNSEKNNLIEELLEYFKNGGSNFEIKEIDIQPDWLGHNSIIAIIPEFDECYDETDEQKQGIINIGRTYGIKRLCWDGGIFPK